MPTPLTASTLDAILALQLTVAWAGEGRKSAPLRLGWWETDLVDLDGGGDFFKRLLPQTHAWASLEAVREAARRVDEKARGKMAQPDALRTLFFLGFETDEQVGDRLASLKRAGRPPAEALPLEVPFAADFSQETLASALWQGGEALFEIVPGGRQLKGKSPEAPEEIVRRLASALVPFAEQYPLPFFRVES